MTLRSEIETVFQSELFERPLFYSYPQGLRFKLSDEGSSIEQFLAALDRASEICRDIFASNETLTVCIRTWSRGSRFSHRLTIKELWNAGIRVAKQRCIWVQKSDDEEDLIWLNVAFNLPLSLLQNMLWCALAMDFGFIRPNPRCLIYLINFDKQLVVFPYDDRGMDVVGEKIEYLSILYRKFNSYLLDHDREVMDANFENF